MDIGVPNFVNDIMPVLPTLCVELVATYSVRNLGIHFVEEPLMMTAWGWKWCENTARVMDTRLSGLRSN